MKGQELWRSVFSTENRFMQACEKIFDLVMVNLLFLLSCLPIFTIGIAKLSMQETVMRLRTERRVSVLKCYVQSFKKQTRLGLQMGLLELVVYSISVLNLLLFTQEVGLAFQVIKVVSVGLLLFFTLIFLAAYPLQVRHPMSMMAGLQFSLVLVSLNLVWFLMLMALLWAAFSLAALSSLSLVLLLFFLLLGGFSLLSWLQEFVLDKCEKKYPILFEK